MPHTTEDNRADGATAAPDGFARVRAVADAVLYEGYLLYPYRRSSAKNRVRWQFGLLAPRPWIEADGPVAPAVAGSTESWYQQTECLLRAPADAVLRVRVRCLHLQHRRVEQREADGRWVSADSLEVAGEVHLPFDEAVPRESELSVPLAELLRANHNFSLHAPGGTETEELPGGTARLVRERHRLLATTTLSAERIDGSAVRLRVRTENTDTSVGPGTPREEALRHALISTHTFLGGRGIAFASLTDPPDWAAPLAPECRNIHTFPVLAGDPGTADLLFSSPIILSDHPQVAPESPGDLHDAAEIDEILSLRTLLLTDEEKREARATDRRAADILDRVDAMPPEVFARLHGTIRSLRPATAPTEPRTPAEEKESGWR
ncbi:hypothetical protein [Streptomyces sp. TR06-5]|uniref:hypothetical protein n=1 Tax=unclassified Streptomyces TaxID=2593676 RepID=UPI0039A0A879